MLNRILISAATWAGLGLASGVYWRELTKFTHFTGVTQLYTAHTHALALGLLMLASTLNHSLLELITYDDIAEELVGIGVASIGLVLAIPLTTAIAALLVGAPRPAEEGDARGVTPSSRPQPRH